MADDDVFVDDNPPPQSGSNTKTILIITGVVAVCLLLCCGGGLMVAWKAADAFKTFAQNMVISDPDEIRKQTAEMVDIEIPASFQPHQGMNMVAVRFVMYETDANKDGSTGMLMLMEMATQQFGVNPQQQEQELRKSMQQQQAGQGFTSSKSERREIEIRRQTVPFDFVEGTTTLAPGQEKKTHMISGVFKGKRGPVMLQLMLPDEDYDEEAVMKMLQSIK